ncbi:MAG: hypothetical protein WC831_02415 [Parcubacteria group bacterium]|jgi:hypothetical protein
MNWKLKLVCSWALVLSLFVTIILHCTIFMVTAMGLQEGSYWETRTGEIRGETVDYRVELRQLIAKKCIRYGYELRVISQVIELVPKGGSGETIVGHDFEGNGSWKLAVYHEATEVPGSKFSAINGAIEARKLIGQAVKILPAQPLI